MAAHIEDTRIPDETIEVIREKEDAQFLDEKFEGAREAEAADKQMSLWQGLKLYPKAAAWSLSLSLALVMVGYDNSLMKSFFAFPAFRQKYGEQISPGKYQITAPWQSGLANAVQCGELVGLFINGYTSDRWGYRKTMIVTYFMLIALIFMQVFAPNIKVLLASQLLCGMGWGVFITLTTTYAAEVCPIVLRYYLSSWVNLCWIFGDLIAAGVLRALLKRNDEWGYKIPFALEWMFPVPLVVVVYLCPESPWWLARKNKLEEAVMSVRRLTVQSSNPDFDPYNAVSNMAHTVALEKRIYSTSRYIDCFRGIDRRRTEIACISYFIQAICGAVLFGYATYFFESAGLSFDYAFDMGIVKQAVGISGTFVSWFASNWIGRRDLFIIGLIGMAIIQLIMGFVSLCPITNMSANWATGALLLLLNFVHEIFIAAPTYCIIPEVSSNKLRPKTMVLARNLYNVAMVVQNVLISYMMNPSHWNLRGKVGFIFGGLDLIALVYVWYRLPETKSRSYGELEILFDKNIRARDFSKTEVDPFEVSLDVDTRDFSKIKKGI